MLPEVRPGLSESLVPVSQVQSPGDLHWNHQGCLLKCRCQDHSAPLAGISGLQPGKRNFGKHPGDLTCTSWSEGLRSTGPGFPI